MPITIGANIASLRTQRQLGETTDRLAAVYERLSSGQRINHASDDAAGLSIASQLNSSARVFSQAIRNVNDGISALNVAEGATQQLTSILQRQRELATQSANGTYGTGQRSALQNESNKLTEEFNRIIATTMFNGVNVLDGSAGRLQLQVGVNGSSGSQITADLSGLVATSSSSSSFPNQTAQSGSVESDTFDFSSLVVAPEISTMYVDVDGAAAFASGGGPADYVEFYTVDGAGMQRYHYLWFNPGGGMSDPGDVVSGIEVVFGSTDDQSQVASAIMTALAGVSDLSPTDLGSGFIQLTNSNAGSVTDIHSNTMVTGVSQQGGSPLNRYFEFSTPTTNYYAWFDNGSGVDPNIAGRTGVAIPYLIGDAIPLHVAFGVISPLLGAQANVSYSDLTNTLTIANTARGAVSAPDVSGMAGTMSVTRNTIGVDTSVNIASDTFTISNHGYTTGQTLRMSSTGSLPPGLSAATTYYAIVVDSNTVKFATSLANAQAGTAVNITNYGSGTITLTSSLITATTSATPYLTNLDLTTQAASRSALDTLTTQDQLVSTSLGSIGSALSRINSVLSTLAVARENNLAAASRIADADIGAESAALVRGQILQEAAASVLAQANQQPALAIRLLKP